MSPLAILLWIKIIGTFFFVAVPFLILSKNALDRRSGFGSSSISIYRLYGVAILALLVGYLSGVFQVMNGQYPVGIVAMGFVSNTGAVLVLFKTVPRTKKTMMSALFFAIIAIGLAASYFLKDLALKVVW